MNTFKEHYFLFYSFLSVCKCTCISRHLIAIESLLRDAMHLFATFCGLPFPSEAGIAPCIRNGKLLKNSDYVSNCL